MARTTRPKATVFSILLAHLLYEPPANVELFCLFTIRSDGAAAALSDARRPGSGNSRDAAAVAAAANRLSGRDRQTAGGLARAWAAADLGSGAGRSAGGGRNRRRRAAAASLYDIAPLSGICRHGSLTLEQYDSIGGIAGSIEMALKQALARPGDAPAIPAAREEQFALLRATFIPWLARVDPETGVPMRRVERLDEFPPDARAMVARLIEARLLVTDRRSGADVVEVAHESLLRQWPELQSGCKPTPTT